jgi:CHAT domain-containing protein
VFDGASHRLFDIVFANAIQGIPAGATIVVVPDGPLCLMPFAAARNRESRLVIEDHPLVTVPSFTALRHATAAQKLDAPRRALVIVPAADADGAASFPALPASPQEAQAIERLYETTVLAGTNATADRFVNEAGRYEIVHFSGHAVADLQFPLLSRLLLSPGAGSSSALTAFDLERVRFDTTRIVVLASCEGAYGTTVRGEGVLTLVRPFLAAGVPSVVASLWELHDRPAATLFGQFHRLVSAGEHPVHALRQVQLDASRLPGSVPQDWAGLTAFGAVPVSTSKKEE